MCDGTLCPCNLGIGRHEHPELSWAGPWPWSRRCRAVRDPEHVQAMGGAFRVGGYHGRCELAPHGPEIDHALDRGMDVPRWSTRWTQ